MEANKLMIDDLVDVHRCECVADGGHYEQWNEYGKVVSITECYITIKYIGREDDYGFEDVDEKDINPIPLTAEILEKNFAVDNSPSEAAYEGTRYTYGDEFIEVEITEYTDGLWQVEVYEIEVSGLPCQLMFVNNVNELQHALRLCNIDKTINL